MLFAKSFVGLTLAISLIGCNQGFVGSYDAEVRLMDGREELERFPLAAAKKKLASYPESLELKPNGRYLQQLGGKLYEGDWWAEDDVKIGMRCDRQNGQALAKGLVSEDADYYLTVRNRSLVRGYWGSTESNLEWVYIKK